MFQASPNTQAKKLTVGIDLRVICVLLVLIIAGMLVVWRPWIHTTSTRKITVTGEATVKSEPDEYQLLPYFEFTGDQTKATADASAMATQVSAKLKEIGVKESEIKSNTGSYDKYTGTAVDPNGTTNSLQLTYTITLTNKDTAQKVQDYFLSVTAKGQLSPQATFSEAKSKELDAQARAKAIDDAKAKAQKSASEVGAKIGKVITISDGTGGGIIRPLAMSSAMATDAASNVSIPVQSGQNDFTSSVQVEYELH